MKIVFVTLSPDLLLDIPQPRNIGAPLDIGYAIALLERGGHDCYLIDTEAVKYSFNKLVNEINALHPDWIGIKTTTPTVDVALKLAEELKKRGNVRIFSFGQHASIVPETFLYKSGFIDLCVIGECEITITELIERYNSVGDLNKIDGIAFYDEKSNSVVYSKPRELLSDLDKLPFPKHELFLSDNYRTFHPVSINRKVRLAYVETSRGCPYNCIFCSPTLRVSFGKKYRVRSIEKVVDEVEHLVSKGVNVIRFVDDIFTLDGNRVEQLCDAIIRRNIQVKWIIQTRADHIDRNLLKKMKAAGCSTLGFGVESGVERIIKILKKDETLEQIEKAFKLAKEEKLLTVAFFMIGCPTETREDIEKTFMFCKKIQPDMIQVAFFTPYPGSPAYNSSMGKTKFSKFSHYNEVAYNPSNVPPEELKRLQRNFYMRYYLSPQFLIKYLKYRFIYSLLNFKSEFGLICYTAKFFFKSIYTTPVRGDV